MRISPLIGRLLIHFDLRFSAYLEAINALGDILDFYERKDQDEMCERKITDTEKPKLEKKYSDGRDKIKRIMRAGSLLLSKEAVNLINLDPKFEEANKNVANGDWYEEFQNDWEIIINAHRNFITRTQKDLGITL